MTVWAALDALVALGLLRKDAGHEDVEAQTCGIIKDYLFSLPDGRRHIPG